MASSLNIDVLGTLGLGGLLAIFFGLSYFDEGRAINLKDSKYVRDGVRTSAEITSDFHGTRIVATDKTRYRPPSTSAYHVHEVLVTFKLPSGTTVSKTIEVRNEMEPTIAGRSALPVTYLPDDPLTTAQVEGFWDYDAGTGTHKIQKGLWLVSGGLVALGLVCYWKRADIKSFFGLEP